VVEVSGENAKPWYIRQPSGKEPDFGAESLNYSMKELPDGAKELNLQPIADLRPAKEKKPNSLPVYIND